MTYAKKTDGPEFFDSDKYPSLTIPPPEPVDHDDTFDDSNMEVEEAEDDFEDVGNWEDENPGDPFKTPKRKSGRPEKTGKTSPR